MIQIMRFRDMDVLASSHVMDVASLIHLASLTNSKITSQSRHVLARETNSETVHRRSFQGRWSENIGDVRPTELNLKPLFAIASLSPSMISRNGMTLQTLHRGMAADAMCVVWGVLLTVQPS
jgi:hypothetical protein